MKIRLSDVFENVNAAEVEFTDTVMENDAEFIGKSKCGCGARKRVSAPTCSRCRFVKDNPDRRAWASRICMDCKSEDAIIKDGARQLRCHTCSESNLIGRKANILQGECKVCGGRNGKRLKNHQLCATCRRKQRQYQKKNVASNAIRDLDNNISRCCRTLLSAGIHGELALRLMKTMDEYLERSTIE